ncbi:MAG: glycosyltransferase, partial [Anaerolineae bacterium]
VGSSGGVEEEIVRRAGLPFRAIPAGGLRGLAPWRAVRNLIRLSLGVICTWEIIGDFSPEVVFVTGGYVCVPVVVSAWLRRLPILIYLPDIVPGLAIRFLARLASRIAVSFTESRAFFAEDKVVVTGYPVRRQFFTVDEMAGRKAMGLKEGLKTVMVFGGSQGAHSLNVALDAVLDQLLENYQVIHVCGPRDAARVEKRRGELSEATRERYKAFPYLHEEMVSALAAADLVVARAGAATLGEFPALGLASILVPYPYAGGHQDINAAYLARHGGAMVLKDSDLNEKLLPAVIALLEDDKSRMEMGHRVRSLSHPEAAGNIVAELRRLAHRGAHGA